MNLSSSEDFSTDSPVIMNAYNYETDEPVSFKLKDHDDLSFKIGTEEFYVKKTIKLTSRLIEKSKEFKASEERRDSEKYLTLR